MAELTIAGNTLELGSEMLHYKADSNGRTHCSAPSRCLQPLTRRCGANRIEEPPHLLNTHTKQPLR